MNNHERQAQSPTEETRHANPTMGREAAARRLRSRLAWLGLLAMIPVALALLAYGCGHQPSDDASTSMSGTTPAVQAAASTNGPAVAAQAAASPQSSAAAVPAAPSGSGAEAPAEAGSGSLPPDLVASVADTLVRPGETVEILVGATPDVSEIALWDGLNDRQAFTYDSTAQVWLASYRVPLRPAQDRLGLSVTAKNDGNRWRRVWVFLRVQRGTAVSEPR